VIQQGKNNIALKEITGPMKLKYFERFQSQKAREFKQLRAGNVENLLQKPKMTDLKSHPLTRANLEKIHKDLSKSTPVPGLITPEGRLLVAVRTGGYAGLLEFGIEGGCATYSYVKGDINYPEYEEKLWDAAIKGTAVGSCSAVTVFLGASPGGLIVTAVCVGTYLITDQVVTVWRENQKRKFLTVEDLKAWGFELDSILAIPVDSNLVLPQNTILEMRSEPVLQIPTDSVLAM
ncbi:MAG: hypothetical protein J6A23_10355, partial [Thermoguttaceae bacterium]|nr:hypothetical protein [Thermoguttaceae bacterium]